MNGKHIGTIALKAVSFIWFRFIANITDECLFWRSKVPQTTCFPDKDVLQNTTGTAPILTNNADTRPATQLSQRLRGYGPTSGSVCLVETELMTMEIFSNTTLCPVVFVFMSSRRGWYVVLRATALNGKIWIISCQKQATNCFFDQLLSISQADHTHVSLSCGLIPVLL